MLASTCPQKGAWEKDKEAFSTLQRALARKGFQASLGFRTKILGECSKRGNRVVKLQELCDRKR